MAKMHSTSIGFTKDSLLESKVKTKKHKNYQQRDFLSSL